MNHYILIFNSKRYNINADCCGGYNYVNTLIDFDKILSNFLCTYCKIYEESILISSSSNIFEELNQTLLEQFKNNKCVYILLDVGKVYQKGWTYENHWTWIRKYFEEKNTICKDSCLDNSTSAFNYSEIK